MGQVVTCSPSVSAMRPLQVRAFETQICKTSFPASRRRPIPFPSRAIARQSTRTRLVTERLRYERSWTLAPYPHLHRATLRPNPQLRSETSGLEDLRLLVLSVSRRCGSEPDHC